MNTHRLLLYHLLLVTIHSSIISRLGCVWARSLGKVLVHRRNFSPVQRLSYNRSRPVFVHSGRLFSLDRQTQHHCGRRVTQMRVQATSNDLVLDILQNSLRNDVDGGIYHQSVQFLQIMTHKANSYDPAVANYDENKMDLGTIELERNNKSNLENIVMLSSSGHTAVNALYQLVYRLRSSKVEGGKKQTKRGGSGRTEWRALQQVVISSFSHSKDLDLRNKDRRSRAVAVLTLGIILSLQPNDANDIEDNKLVSIQPITKMISSALLTDISTHVYESVVSREQYQLHRQTEEDLLIYDISSSTVIDLLKRFTQLTSAAVDIQVINKITQGLCVGDRVRAQNEDNELQKIMSTVVDTIFGKRIRDEESGLMINNEVISKDSDAAVLSLVASIKPWEDIQADRLVTIAAEHDLWFAAENICDSAIESTDDVQSIASQKSVAHLTTRAIIDAALDHRQYRRADHFASKYYTFGGPERFAEARYLHACDTISKLVRKKVIPLIDKQVERVDAAKTRVMDDTSPSESTIFNKDGSDAVSIEKMSEHVRQFCLRRLRAANMNSEALRLARLWNMTYAHDPVAIMEEIKQRKLTYLQWDDEGCPGHSTENARILLPELISEPQDLINQFGVLLNNNEETIGFDCEWGGDELGVSLLQLSSTTEVLLLDIPALTSTNEGCDALRVTVGKLFSGALSIKYVVGFSCKEDFSRLRASPSLPEKAGSKHWFPSHSKLKAKDLRNFIAETHQLGSRGSALGLSAACHFFLGKALDKAEQCSDWSMRPLTLEQREYASLDAWACAAIHHKIAASHEVLPIP